MIEDIIDKLISEGIKIEKTKSRYDAFQPIFNRNRSSSLYIWNGPFQIEKKISVHNK